MTTTPADQRERRGARTVDTVSYSRPVKATLHVHLDNGEKWEATAADLEQFRLVPRLDAYMAFDDAYRAALTRAGLLRGDDDQYDKPGQGQRRYDLTDAELNPVRYLVETAVSMPQLLEHPEHEGWDMVADLERRLRREAVDTQEDESLAQFVRDVLFGESDVIGDERAAVSRAGQARAGMHGTIDGLRRTLERIEHLVAPYMVDDGTDRPDAIRIVEAVRHCAIVAKAATPGGSDEWDGDNAEPGQEDIADHGDDDGSNGDGELADDLPPGS